MKKTPVIFDHDGNADDFISLILVLAMQHVDLKGISITPADCYIENALETTQKLLTKAGRTDIEIGLGNHYGINAFPANWRANPKILNAFPSLILIDTDADQSHFVDGKTLFVNKLKEAEEPVTILLTGPCSNLLLALEEEPTLANKIETVVWMAGAFDVPGNVVTYNHDGTAEWNIFWDPVSANKLLKYNLSMVFIPLDVTNQVAVTTDFLKELARHADHFWANLAAQFWATTLDTVPAYAYTYYMWDALATSYLEIPEAFTLEEIETDIIPTGPSAGRTIESKGSGLKIKVAKQVDKTFFFDYLIKTFTNAKSV